MLKHFATQLDPVTEFIKLGSALKQGTILVPKLADLLYLQSSTTPFVFR
jgi:hypothetical protein